MNADEFIRLSSEVLRILATLRRQRTVGSSNPCDGRLALSRDVVFSWSHWRFAVECFSFWHAGGLCGVRCSGLGEDDGLCRVPLGRESGEPPRLFGVEPPKPRIQAVRIVDVSGSNAWAEFAGIFART